MRNAYFLNSKNKVERDISLIKNFPTLFLLFKKTSTSHQPVKKTHNIFRDGLKEVNGTFWCIDLQKQILLVFTIFQNQIRFYSTFFLIFLIFYRKSNHLNIFFNFILPLNLHSIL
jgi:hypothetical protein